MMMLASTRSASAAAARPAAAAPPRAAAAPGRPRLAAARATGGGPKFTPPKLEAPTADEVSAKLSQAGESLAKAWDKTEDKPTAVFFAGAALVLLVCASSVVSAVEAIPVLGDSLKLVGVGATAFFSYKYLVVPEDRAALVADVKALLAKIGL